MLDESDKSSEMAAAGSYDKYYRTLGITWRDTPGRMVVRATEIFSPTRILDAGCGDGKNSFYLAKRGSKVSAFDISPAALSAFNLRAARSPEVSGIDLFQADAAKLHIVPESFDFVLAYGLYHCLDDNEVFAAHARLTSALMPGGMFAFAAFNDQLPLPDDHQTPRLTLRPAEHIISLLGGWEVDTLKFGTITEHHLPLVSEHTHALTWGLFRKPRL